MKTPAVLLLFLSTSLYAQVQPPSEGKAVVYFARTSGLGALINFQYYDKDRYIGKFNGEKYMRYECAPGEHIFWARSENADFVLAELEAGRTYFVHARPQMGGIKAQVQLVAVSPTDAKTMGKILKLISKRSPQTFAAEELAKGNDRFKDVISEALIKYEDRKQRGEIEHLTKEMYYEVAK